MNVDASFFDKLQTALESCGREGAAGFVDLLRQECARIESAMQDGRFPDLELRSSLRNMIRDMALLILLTDRGLAPLNLPEQDQRGVLSIPQDSTLHTDVNILEWLSQQTWDILA